MDKAFLEANIPEKIKDLLLNNVNLISSNYNYLKSIGVTNCIEIFNKFYELFLLDTSIFKVIFEKYDLSDLISKLQKNINIIEVL